MILTHERTGYELLTFIQHSIAGAIAQDKMGVRILPEGILVQQVRIAKTGDEIPQGITFDTGGILQLLNLHRALAPDDLLAIIRADIDKAGADLKRLVSAQNPAEASDAIRDFFTPDPRLGQLWAAVQNFAVNQFAIGLTLVTSLRNITKPELPDKLLHAYHSYFFSEHGYETIDGIFISPPMNLSGLPNNLQDLRSFVSEKTAARYMRDLTSVIVEALGDTQYELVRRLATLKKTFSEVQLKTAMKWLKAYSSMAEAAVTSAVEELGLGFASFQTNPLIAAAAGTYAGTAAKKATQHVVLSELGA